MSDLAMGRMSDSERLLLASAEGKFDTHGHRAAGMLTLSETIAMAAHIRRLTALVETLESAVLVEKVAS